MHKLLVAIAVIALASSPSLVLAQQKMDDMPMGKGMDMGKGMGMGMQPAASATTTYTATGVVKKADPGSGVVTLSHEPVKDLNWPAMTMGFKVADKASFTKLVEGKKVEVQFKRIDKDYVITAVK